MTNSAKPRPLGAVGAQQVLFGGGTETSVPNTEQAHNHPMTQPLGIPTAARIQVGDGEPFEVEGLRFVWATDDHTEWQPFAPLTMDSGFDLSFKATPEWAAWFTRMSMDLDDHAEKRATANRRYWSGPDKFDRKILRAYRVKFRHIGLAPRSVLDDRYRRKQINRRKRR